jgi:hypothetical protein
MLAGSHRSRITVIPNGTVEKPFRTLQVHGRCPHLPMRDNTLGADGDVCRPQRGLFQHSLERGIFHHGFALQILVLILRALDYIERW